MIPVYQAGSQIIKVRAIMVLSLNCLALGLWWGVDLVQTFGLNEADGGSLAPLPHRLALGTLLASLGLAFAAGMWLYGRVYAARIDFDPNKEQLRLETVGFFKNKLHVIELADLGSAYAHPDPNRGVVGQFLQELPKLIAILGQAPLADAPWRSVRIMGWRLPLIIDEQGHVLHHPLMKILFGQRRVIAPRRHLGKPELISPENCGV